MTLTLTRATASCLWVQAFEVRNRGVADVRPADRRRAPPPRGARRPRRNHQVRHSTARRPVRPSRFTGGLHRRRQRRFQRIHQRDQRQFVELRLSTPPAPARGCAGVRVRPCHGRKRASRTTPTDNGRTAAKSSAKRSAFRLPRQRREAGQVLEYSVRTPARCANGRPRAVRRPPDNASSRNGRFQRGAAAAGVVADAQPRPAWRALPRPIFQPAGGQAGGVIRFAREPILQLQVRPRHVDAARVGAAEVHGEADVSAATRSWPPRSSGIRRTGSAICPITQSSGRGERDGVAGDIGQRVGMAVRHARHSTGAGANTRGTVGSAAGDDAAAPGGVATTTRSANGHRCKPAAVRAIVQHRQAPGTPRPWRGGAQRLQAGAWPRPRTASSAVASARIGSGNPRSSPRRAQQAFEPSGAVQPRCAAVAATVGAARRSANRATPRRWPRHSAKGSSRIAVLVRDQAPEPRLANSAGSTASDPRHRLLRSTLPSGCRRAPLAPAPAIPPATMPASASPGARSSPGPVGFGQLMAQGKPAPRPPRAVRGRDASATDHSAGACATCDRTPWAASMSITATVTGSRQVRRHFRQRVAAHSAGRSPGRR